MYGAKDFIDRFNADIRDEGNIEWGLAYHPYPHPMTEPEFWDDDQTGAVNNTEDSPVVNFKNLNVLTDYFQKDIMRDAGGNVRHIILSLRKALHQRVRPVEMSMISRQPLSRMHIIL